MRVVLGTWRFASKVDQDRFWLDPFSRVSMSTAIKAYEAIKSVICRKHIESLIYIKSVLVIESRIVFCKKKDEYAFKPKTFLKWLLHLVIIPMRVQSKIFKKTVTSVWLISKSYLFLILIAFVKKLNLGVSTVIMTPRNYGHRPKNYFRSYMCTPGTYRNRHLFI